MATQDEPVSATFRVAMDCGGAVEPLEVKGYTLGFFGIDKVGEAWCVTHLRTGQNLSKMAARSLRDAVAAVRLLNGRPDIWDNGRFGLAYTARSKAPWFRLMRVYAQSEEGKRVAAPAT